VQSAKAVTLHGRNEGFWWSCAAQAAQSPRQGNACRAPPSLLARCCCLWSP